MAILVDFSQVVISNLMVQIGNHHNAEVDVSMIRHMILNSLRSYRMKFGDEYGELVICSDDKNYWRKNVFPYYKANRKKNREKSELDWSSIFNALDTVRNELREFFPYRVIQVDKAEADDIIGTYVHEHGRYLNSGEPILILSGDKDYIQLHKYGNVKQYDPVRKRWIRHQNPEQYLADHILKGDSGDGIPNVLSEDNTFVSGSRQSRMTKQRYAKLQDLNNVDEETKRRWHRNSTLIDLEKVPENIQEKIHKAYEAQGGKDRKHLFNYFIKHKLKFLMEHINSF